MIRLFSIEDHWLVTDGLRTKFRKSRDEIVITCSAETIEDAIEGKHDDAFDIILLDLFLPGTEPLENIRKLKERYPGKPIVILTYGHEYGLQVLLFHTSGLLTVSQET